jgi:hypothetical protein
MYTNVGVALGFEGRKEVVHAMAHVRHEGSHAIPVLTAAKKAIKPMLNSIIYHTIETNSIDSPVQYFEVGTDGTVEVNSKFPTTSKTS